MSRALFHRVAAFTLIAGLAWAVATSPAQAATSPMSFADIVDRIAPAVVNISTTKASQSVRNFPFPAPPPGTPGSPFEDFFREFFDPERSPERGRRQTTSLGSGFVVDPQGFVVTNNHVIADAEEISVVFSDDSTYEAELIGRDSKTDLALLKITGDGPFPFLTFADSDNVRVGDWVIAIGNPFGLGNTVTAGIISARSRDINQGPYDDYLQVDAPINRGNSGGPSFNLDGEVIGINTAIFTPSGGNVGIGFAIPANLAVPVIDSLKEDGRVQRGWLGVRIQTVTDEIAESLGLQDPSGALVASVTTGGPAEQAEIEPGDVILSFDGKPIDRMRGLPRIVAETPIGKEVDVRVWRSGSEETVRVTLGELPEDEELAALSQQGADSAPTAELSALGMTVAQLDEELRAQFGLSDDGSGVVVVDVVDGGSASDENIRPGDVIVEVGQEEVDSPGAVAEKVQAARSEGKRSVLLLVDRQGDLRFVALKFSAG